MREMTRLRSASSRWGHLSSTLFKERSSGVLSDRRIDEAAVAYQIPACQRAFLPANAAAHHLRSEISLDSHWYAKYQPQRSYPGFATRALRCARPWLCEKLRGVGSGRRDFAGRTQLVLGETEWRKQHGSSLRRPGRPRRAKRTR